MQRGKPPWLEAGNYIDGLVKLSCYQHFVPNQHAAYDGTPDAGCDKYPVVNVNRLRERFPGICIFSKIQHNSLDADHKKPVIQNRKQVAVIQMNEKKRFSVVIIMDTEI